MVLKKLKHIKAKGLQIYCRKCKSTVSKNRKSSNGCSHPAQSQVYKVVAKLPMSGGKRCSKTLVTRDPNNAIRESVDFIESVQNPTPIEDNYDSNEGIDFLSDCVQMFIDFLNNKDVPEHLKVERDSDYVKTRENYLIHFLQFYKDYIDRDIENARLDSVNDNVVGKYHGFIDKIIESNSSYNHRIKALSGLFNYLIKWKKLDIDNPWKKVKLKAEIASHGSISKKDFFDLLSVINNNDSIDSSDGQNRNRYKYYLKDLFKLAVFTGRRQEEIAKMKWNMIRDDGCGHLYIASPNWKLIRQRKIKDERNYIYAYIPIASELNELLTSLDIKKNRGKDQYIIAPEIEYRKTMENDMNKQFKFFFSKLGRDYNRTFKHLRKTYVTMEALAAAVTKVQHSDIKTTLKFYVDGVLIAINLVKNDFKVYP